MSWLNYRDANNNPMSDTPRILQQASLPQGVQHILLVDDVAVTGKTLHAASMQLGGFHVTTLVLKGRADIVLMPHLNTCVRWPWHHYCNFPQHQTTLT